MFNFIRDYETIFQNDYHFSFPTAKYESCNYSVSLLALDIVNPYGYICLYNYVCVQLLVFMSFVDSRAQHHSTTRRDGGGSAQTFFQYKI